MNGPHEDLHMVWALSEIEAEAGLLAQASAGGIVVRRRCFDAPELLAVCAVVPGTRVLISAQLPRMSGEIMSTLSAQVESVAVLAYDDHEESVARSWNSECIIRADLPGFDLVTALRLASQPDTADGPAGGPAGGPADELAVQGHVQGHVSACWGPVGSHGRTTFAIGLAEALALSGASVLLVDADTVAPAVALILGIEEDTSGIVVAARYAEQNSLDARALANCARSISPNFWVMTGLADPQNWPEVRAGALSRIIERAREHFDHVVFDISSSMDDPGWESGIDLAPGLAANRHVAASTVLAHCDQVYLVTRADAVGAGRLSSMYESHAQLIAQAQRCVVVNMLMKSTTTRLQREFSALCAALDPELEIVYLPNDSAAIDMVRTASTLGELGLRGSLAKAIKECARPQSRRGKNDHRVAHVSPLVKLLSIFRGHTNAPAGSNG